MSKFKYIKVSVWVIVAGYFVFTQAEKVAALSGVGALVNQASGSVSVSVSGRHAPSSEVVVIDQTGKVVAAGKDQGTGLFSFSFLVNSSQVNGLKVFGVDPASETNQVSVPTSGLVNVLLPPSLVVNPQVQTDDNDLAVGGYTYPGSSVSLFLEKVGGGLVQSRVTAAGDGGYEYVFVNLEPGKYELQAASEIDGLASIESLVLEVVVEPPLNPVANAVGKQVSKVVEKVSEAVLPPVVTRVAKSVAPQAEQVNKAVTPVASAGLLAQLVFVGRDLIYWLLQAAIALMQYFGFWRKRHPWGLVYDAYTKQPVMLSTVRLYTAEKFPRLVETDVTSKAGVFSFFPKAGKYIIKVAKTGYVFPSKLVRGSSDGEYGNIYHGEEVEFTGLGSVVEVSVPIDPAQVNVSLRFRILNFIRSRVYLFTIGMLVIGWSLSFLSVVGGRGGINGLMLVFYSGTLVFHGYLIYRRSKAWGTIYDAAGNPLPGIQLNLVDPKFEKLVQRRVSDERGKYQFVVPEGLYQIRIDTVGYELVVNRLGVYAGQEIQVKGAKPQLIALKVVVDKKK